MRPMVAFLPVRALGAARATDETTDPKLELRMAATIPLGPRSSIASS